MVVGLDRWRDHFGDYADRYALVGGVACDQLMVDAGLQFRATKDLDVVLVIELLDVAFAEAFWAFIEAGGYEVRSKGDGGKLYRFANPTTLEARLADAQGLRQSHIRKRRPVCCAG